MSIPSKTACACLLLFAAASEARTWGFDKDTVYESRPGGDTLWLVNNGPDTLRLDSVFAEGVDTPFWLDVVFYYRKLEPPPFFYRLYGLTQEGSSYKIKMDGDAIPAGTAILLEKFGVHSASVLKSSGNSMGRDNLQVRLRFKSAQGEEDTLTVKGRFNDFSSLRALIKTPNRIDKSNRLRDLRGRSIRLREGTPAPPVRNEVGFDQDASPGPRPSR